MRRNRSSLLAAGTMLALIAVPALAIAAPDRAESTTPSPAATPQNLGDDGLNVKGTPDRMHGISDAQIGDRLRDIITSKLFEQRIGGGPERKAVESFYAARNYAPLWTGEGKLNARAKSAIMQMKNAAIDGLDPADYPVPDVDLAASAAAAADDEIRLTHSILTYARHLATGRVAPSRVLAEVDYGNHTPEPAEILQKIANSGDAAAALESYNPPHDGFRALKAKLAELRALASETGNVIPDQPTFRSRAAKSRAPTTSAAINTMKPGQQIDRVLANMERWRWLPRDLGKTYVMVNIPDFTLKVVHDHQEQWRTKIVAGKPQTPTPLLSASMDTVLVNPSWHVPQSIIQNEMLPRYGRDPNIFARMGLEVKRRPDGTLSVTQPPGAANALGRIKFNFPNKFQVYLHDTPEKRLFAADKRAFSHGCMRVQDPTRFGEVMLHLAMSGPTPNAQQLSALFGRDERTFKLTDRPMVHLTYQTAFVDAGRLVLRDDIYGFDARINAILHSDERRIADVTPPQDLKRDLATAKANQEILRRVERGEADNAFELLSHLYRAPARSEPKRPTAAIRPRPIAAATPEFRPQASGLSLPGPLLAIFGR
ncbi:MAG: L,D-transpeptidase family protein [Pseudolabrys sp.]